MVLSPSIVTVPSWDKEFGRTVTETKFKHTVPEHYVQTRPNICTHVEYCERIYAMFKSQFQ